MLAVQAAEVPTSWPKPNLAPLIPLSLVDPSSTAETNMKDWCLLLCMCSRPNVFRTYERSLDFWEKRSDKIYFVDGCHVWNRTNRVLSQIPYTQVAAHALGGRSLSPQETLEIQASLRHMPPSCAFIVKLTGKYMVPSLIQEIEKLPHSVRTVDSNL